MAPVMSAFADELRRFDKFGSRASVRSTEVRLSKRHDIANIPTYINEFWTAKQRQAHSLHEISYRACFKPQLPRFFIERLTEPGDAVYDPFMGRGTTPLESALMGRTPLGNDANPLCAQLLEPRLNPPDLAAVEARLDEIDWSDADSLAEDLLVFYHPETLRKLCALRHYLLGRRSSGAMDGVDKWIRMVAVNRLTGHSPGFFSVYTMPPNQAVSVQSQRKINARRNQIPPERDVRGLILKKTRALLKDCGDETGETLARAAEGSRLFTAPADATPQIASDSISLVVTSPPFLDVVDYAKDNWLRCWFCDIDPASVSLSIHKRLAEWTGAMTRVFRELARVLRPGGRVAFEVGEVRRGEILLEEATIPCGVEAGLDPILILINDQEFTKTANCWGVENRRKGTNTNRIVLFRKRG